MFSFFLKKNFVDIWENLFHLIVVNIITVAVICLSIFFIPFVFAAIPAEDNIRLILDFLTVITVSVAVTTVIFAESANAKNISYYETASVKSFFKSIPSVFKHSAAAGIFFGLVYMAARISLPYYAALADQLYYRALAVFLFWFLAVTVIALQYLFPVYALMGNHFFKSLKKCYIIFFDNVAFSIGLTLVNILNVAISLLTLGMAPGIAGISYTCTNALKLRLYKYDWLEVNPGLSRKEQKNVPWTDLLKKEEEMLGPHPIKNALIPWKRSK